MVWVDQKQIKLIFGIIVLGFMILIYSFFLSTPDHAWNELLSEDERIWLNNHDGKIRLAPSPDWEPMEFFDKNGNYQGMVADYIRLIEKKLDFKFKIARFETWEKILVLAQKREIDVISAAQVTPERKKFMNWSTPYLSLKTTIIVQKSRKKHLRWIR